jgi:hypothetical protein
MSCPGCSDPSFHGYPADIYFKNNNILNKNTFSNDLKIRVGS